MTTTNVNAVPFSPVFNPYGWAGLGATGYGPQFQGGNFAQPTGVQGVPTGVTNPATWSSGQNVNPAATSANQVTQQNVTGQIPLSAPWQTPWNVYAAGQFGINPWQAFAPWQGFNPWQGVNAWQTINPWLSAYGFSPVNPYQVINPLTNSFVNPWQFANLSTFGATFPQAAFSSIYSSGLSPVTSSLINPLSHAFTPANTFTGFPTNVSSWNVTNPLLTRSIFGVPYTGTIGQPFVNQFPFTGNLFNQGIVNPISGYSPLTTGIAPITGTIPTSFTGVTNPYLGVFNPFVNFGGVGNPISSFGGIFNPYTGITNSFSPITNPYAGITNSVFGLTQPVSTFGSVYGGLPLNTGLTNTINPFISQAALCNPVLTNSVFGQGVATGWGLGSVNPINFGIPSFNAGISPFGMPISGVTGCEPVACVSPVGAMGLAREAA